MLNRKHVQAIIAVLALLTIIVFTAQAQDVDSLYLPLVIGSMASPTPTPSPTATPDPGSNKVEEILIPAGTFQMGCDSSNSVEFCNNYEQPLHAVNLDTYHIDKYEVTNVRYKACVDAGVCTAPGSTSSKTRPSYFGNADHANYPVIHVNWTQANAFCLWEGKRLPTEAQWEKAARGSSDTRAYPWGDVDTPCSLANYGQFGSCVGDTTAVGSYPGGASPYGVMDMAGNVLEWVNDWWQEDYYSVSPNSNPQGPDTGEYRVVRGGSWFNSGYYVRSAYRNGYHPDYWYNGLGFRCVRSP
jgi:formylglycine-generating enzyme required for sulfatase activity